MKVRLQEDKTPGGSTVFGVWSAGRLRGWIAPLDPYNRFWGWTVSEDPDEAMYVCDENGGFHSKKEAVSNVLNERPRL